MFVNVSLSCRIVYCAASSAPLPPLKTGVRYDSANSVCRQGCYCCCPPSAVFFSWGKLGWSNDMLMSFGEGRVVVAFVRVLAPACGSRGCTPADPAMSCAWWWWWCSLQRDIRGRSFYRCLARCAGALAPQCDVGSHQTNRQSLPMEIEDSHVPEIRLLFAPIFAHFGFLSITIGARPREANFRRP